MKDWLKKLGVVNREAPADGALQIDYSELKPLGSFRRRHSGGPLPTKVCIDADLSEDLIRR